MIAAALLALALSTPAVPAARVMLAAAPAPTAPCAATDLMPTFWKYWDAAKGLPRDEQVRLFQERVMGAHAAIYGGVFEGMDKQIPKVVGESLDKMPSVEAGMRELSARLSDELPRQIARFREAFPKFRCEEAVYFLYSAGEFDGGTRDVSGKEALMFGLDVIAMLKEPLSPLFTHELFHVYHAERIPKAPEAFYWNMWEEGLASYVSAKLNPNAPACCLPPAPPIDAALPKIVAGVLERLDSESRDDYRPYFFGGENALGLPQRSGYVLGYRIAAEAGKTRSLEELAELQPAEVRKLVEAGLRRMQPGKP
jgi:hypothetical protein